MKISSAPRDGAILVTVEGRLDADTSAAFGEALDRLIDQGHRRFVLDLARLDYVSSAGLRVLLMAAKRLKSQAGQIVLASVQARIREILDIAGFSSIFAIYPTSDEAARHV